MSWETDFATLCLQHKIEAVVEGSEYLLIVPKMPDKEIQDKLRAIVPQEIQYRYVEGPRLVTTVALKTLFQQIGHITAVLETKDHTMMFKIDGEPSVFSEEDPKVLNFIESVLSADPFVKDWKIVFNGKTIHDTTLEKMLAMQVRPERDSCPTQDDILDLRISLEVSQDVNEFVNSL
jgi:hypothetical protein